MAAGSPLLWLITVGIIWGATNPFIKRGAELSAARRKAQEAVEPHLEQEPCTAPHPARVFIAFWLSLFQDWQVRTRLQPGIYVLYPSLCFVHSVPPPLFCMCRTAV